MGKKRKKASQIGWQFAKPKGRKAGSGAAGTKPRDFCELHGRNEGWKRQLQGFDN